MKVSVSLAIYTQHDIGKEKRKKLTAWERCLVGTFENVTMMRGIGHSLRYLPRTKFPDIHFCLHIFNSVWMFCPTHFPSYLLVCHA